MVGGVFGWWGYGLVGAVEQSCSGGVVGGGSLGVVWGIGVLEWWVGDVVRWYSG